MDAQESSLRGAGRLKAAVCTSCGATYNGRKASTIEEDVKMFGKAWCPGCKTAVEFSIRVQKSRNKRPAIPEELKYLESLAFPGRLESMARQPELSGKTFTTMLIAMALVEALAIYCLLIALVILYANPMLG